MHALAGLLLANLPVRWWDRFEDRFPVSRMAMRSAVLACFVGLSLIYQVFLGLGGRGLGLFAFYLLASGMMRAASVIADDVRGDPILTVLDDAVVSRRSAKRTRLTGQARGRREGAEVADRLVKGEVVRSSAEFVLLASRVKPDWRAGTCLIGGDGVPYRVGEPFDLDTLTGLRTAYPLTRLGPLEVIRHAVPYDLPRLSGTA